METWSRLTAARGKGEGKWWEEGEGISQRTCINDTWTWTVVGTDWGGWARWRRTEGEKLGQL